MVCDCHAASGGSHGGGLRPERGGGSTSLNLFRGSACRVRGTELLELFSQRLIADGLSENCVAIEHLHMKAMVAMP